MPGRMPVSLHVAAIAVSLIAVIHEGRTAATRQTSASSNTPPVVQIVRPDASRPLRWGGQFRYAITVSDKEDGDSTFEEITPTDVLLDVEYVPAAADAPGPAQSPARADHPGIAVMRTSACFTCHADKTSLVGPSFSAIAAKYGDGAETIERLGRHIREGSSGNWGTLAMPPHSHLSPQQAQDIARFIVEQGQQRHRWIYAGLEGVIRIIDKPDDAQTGFYTLTASYVDKGVNGATGTRTRGEHSITLRIE